jgi:hypothetical protein
MGSDKMIFAKATATDFCAIAVYRKDSDLMVCDVVESGGIAGFIDDVAGMARKHVPWLVQYECTVYVNECRELRGLLLDGNITVRGYRSEGAYTDRIVSQAGWIEGHVLVNERFSGFVEQMLSFNVADKDKTNIAMDVLSDAAKFMRRTFRF